MPSIGAPRIVGKLPAETVTFAPSHDFQKFLVALPVGGTPPRSLTVVTDWVSGLAKR